MSFKGIKKSIVRAPQNMRQKFNIGEVTTDPVYQDAERRFKELEIETKKLSDELNRYFKAVNLMLDEQMEFSKAIEEIYKPILGKMSDPSATVQEDNPAGIEAAEAYRAVVASLKDLLKPDLELIEKRVVEPAQELLKVINLIRKMATKREHKQVDLDRHKRTLQKLEEKKEPNPKDEEKKYTAQAEVETAQAEYDYYNELMKQELPTLFQLQLEFIKPLFVLFYYMQLNIFYTLYNRMEELKIPYFDLTTDIVEAYTHKKGDAEERADALGITNFKVGHAKSKLDQVRRRQQLMSGALTTALLLPTPTAGSAGTATTGGLPQYTPGAMGGAYGDDKKAGYGAPSATPAYGQPAAAPAYAQPAAAATPAYGQPAAAPAYGQPAGAPAYGLPAPASPAPVAASPAAQTCTALYDYTAQAAGDLTFPAGAVITIVEKTADANGWWTGTYNGQQGVFPGNYVQLN